MRIRPRPEFEYDEDDLPRRKRSLLNRFGVVAAIGFGVAVLIAAGVLLFGPDRPGGPATPQQGHPAPPAATDSVCGLPNGDQAMPVTTPADTTWQTVGTMAAPTDPTLGPGTVGGGLPYCYARSPLGALYAAANWLALHTDPSARKAADTYLTAAGGGRQKLLDAYNTGNGGPGTSDMQIVGFRVLNYDQNSATVDIAMRFGTPLMHGPVPLRWEAGDWKAVIPESGAPFETMQPLDNLDAYVKWSGR